MCQLQAGQLAGAPRNEHEYNLGFLDLYAQQGQEGPPLRRRIPPSISIRSARLMSWAGHDAGQGMMLGEILGGVKCRARLLCPRWRAWPSSIYGPSAARLELPESKASRETQTVTEEAPPPGKSIHRPPIVKMKPFALALALLAGIAVAARPTANSGGGSSNTTPIEYNVGDSRAPPLPPRRAAR